MRRGVSGGRVEVAGSSVLCLRFVLTLALASDGAFLSVWHFCGAMASGTTSWGLLSALCVLV